MEHKEEFKIQELDGYTVLWINSDLSPSAQSPLNCFGYRETFGGEIVFYRLYQVHYGQPSEDSEICHHRFEWREFECKKECRDSLKAMVDIMSGASSFEV